MLNRNSDFKRWGAVAQGCCWSWHWCAGHAPHSSAFVPTQLIPRSSMPQAHTTPQLIAQHTHGPCHAAHHRNTTSYIQITRNTQPMQVINIQHTDTHDVAYFTHPALLPDPRCLTDSTDSKNIVGASVVRCGLNLACGAGIPYGRQTACRLLPF